MSAIQQELCKATKLEAPKSPKDRQEFLVDLLRAVGKLSDAQWEALSKAAQDWFNDAADAKNTKKDEVPDFPDYKEEEAPARRRASSDEAPSGAKKIDPDDVKTGMAVKVVTKRGKEISGHVVDADDEVLVIKQGNGEELETSWKSIEDIFTLAEAKEETTRRRRSAEEEPADPIKVGATVTVKTKRGKEATGEIIELSDDVLVLKEGKEEVEYPRDRLEAITVKGGGKEEEATGRRRASSDDKGSKDEEGKKSRSSNPEGVSISTRIAEIMLDDLDISEADVGKALKKEGLEFRENTLSINYKSTKKFLELLKSRKMLKA